MPRFLAPVLACALALPGCGGREAGPARASDALRSLASAPPVPMGITPDGRRLLLKSAGDTAFELAVLERRTGAVVARRGFADPPLAPALRPDGEAVAYLADRGGDQRYVPMIMEVGRGEARGLGAPPTSIPGPLQWSPDGSRLAYVQAGQRTTSRRLMVSGTGAPGGGWEALLPDVEPRTGFAWSPDGRGLAAVRRSGGGAVSVVSLDGSAREYPVAPDAEIRELLWTPDGRLRATVREAGEQFFAVWEVDLATGAARPVASGPWDATEPQPLDGGAGWAFHANVDSELAPMVCGAGGDGCRRLPLPEGSSRVLGSVPRTDTILVSHRGRSTPATVLPVVPGVAPPRRSPPAGAPPQAVRMDLRSADGLRVPVYAWKAPRPRRGVRAAVIRVHGGPAVQADRGWDRTTEYLLRSGIDVIQLNYRGSTGYGASFERAPGGECARVRDVVAAVSLAEREMGVPRGRIVVYGHSYGALLAARAGREMRDPVGAVVVVSMVAGSAAPAAGCGGDAGRPGPAGRVRAYHGANDQGLSPREARRRLAGMYGWGPLRRARARWRVFSREGHTFHRNESWARVYADIIAVLDGAS